MRFKHLTLGGKFLLSLLPLVAIGSLGTAFYFSAMLDGVGSEAADVSRATAEHASRASAETMVYLLDPTEAQRGRVERSRADFSRSRSRYDASRARGSQAKHDLRLATVFDRIAGLMPTLLERRDKVSQLLDRARALEQKCRDLILAVGQGGALGLDNVSRFSRAALAVLAGSGVSAEEHAAWTAALAQIRVAVGASSDRAAAAAGEAIDALDAAVAAYRSESEPYDAERRELMQVYGEVDSFLYDSAGAVGRSSRSRSSAAIERAVTAVWIVTVLQCTVGAATILVFARGVRSRISRIAHAAGAMAGGELATRVDDRGSDELGELARQFNDMAEKLERTTVSRASLEERETALRVSEQRLRLLVEQLRDCAIFMVSPTGTITSWNAGAERLYGYRENEAMGAPLRMLDADPDSADFAGDGLLAAARHDSGPLDREQRRNDGSLFSAEISITSLDTVQGGVAHVVLVRDVTVERAAQHERQRHLDQLAHVGRLSVMGEMAAGLAHELNQPLGAISNYAEGCLLRLIDGKVAPEMLRDILERISTEAQRAGAIIHRVRVFARKEERQTEEVDLCAAVERVISLLDHDAEKQGVGLRTELARNVPRVTGDRVQIEQVLINLIRNAFDAVRGNGAEAAKEVVVRAELNDEGDAHITVTDTGCGIAEGEEARVFDAFYTTKADGLGMGLAITRTIVEAHGGRIWIARAVPRGVVAHLTVPRRVAA